MTLGTANGAAVALRRLQTLAAALGEADLEQEVDQAARLLRAELPTLPDYAALDANHQAYYDMATGLSAAISLLAPAILRANNGLAKLKEGDEERTFAVPEPAERGRWATEVARAVGYLVRLVRSLEPRPRRQAHMFGAAGVARQRARREWHGRNLVRLIIPGGWVYGGWFDGEVCGLADGLGEGWGPGEASGLTD